MRKDNIELDGAPRYKKKSQRKPPAKAKHKHEYRDCVFEYDCKYGEISKELGWTTTRKAIGGMYCHICGKVEYGTSFDWYDRDSCIFGKLSKRAEQESNPETRTLPTFFLDDLWQKHVDVNRGNVYIFGKQIKELPSLSGEQIQKCKDAVELYIKK